MIVITAPTGQTGHHVVNDLLAAGTLDLVLFGRIMDDQGRLRRMHYEPGQASSDCMASGSCRVIEFGQGSLDRFVPPRTPTLGGGAFLTADRHRVEGLSLASGELI
jgi:hypothetical protein